MQPRNLDTAPGMLLPLVRILAPLGTRVWCSCHPITTCRTPSRFSMRFATRPTAPLVLALRSSAWHRPDPRSNMGGSYRALASTAREHSRWSGSQRNPRKRWPPSYGGAVACGTRSSRRARYRCSGSSRADTCQITPRHSSGTPLRSAASVKARRLSRRTVMSAANFSRGCSRPRR